MNGGCEAITTSFMACPDLKHFALKASNVELKKEETVSRDEGGKGDPSESREVEELKDKVETNHNGSIEDPEEAKVVDAVEENIAVSEEKEVTQVAKESSDEEKVEKVEEKEVDKNNETTEKDEETEKASPKEQRRRANLRERGERANKQLTSKNAYRNHVWAKLENADVSLFPRPCRFRIPRFKGNMEAAERLTELDVFKKSSVVKVTLDKAHECVRLKVIEAGKELIAGTPGLREAVFLHMKPPVDPSKNAIRTASSRVGIHHLGAALKFDQETKADLIIVGAVAVDKLGHRIGKGEGFSDLEYALLRKLGVIEEDAPIVTLVHDMQVFESLPEELFTSFDVPVDYIVTPTQVIEVTSTLPRPELQWNLLSNRRVNNIPIIKQLLDKEISNGEKVELKEVDSDIEDRVAPFRGRFRANNTVMRRRRFPSRRQVQGPGGPGPQGPGGPGPQGPGGPGSLQGRRDMSAPEQRMSNRNIPNRGEGEQMRDGSAPPPNSRNRTRTFRRRMRRDDRMNRGGPRPNNEIEPREVEGDQAGNGTQNTISPQQGSQQAPQQRGGGGTGNSFMRSRMRKISRPRFPIDFTIRINGLTSGVRIRDLKAAVIERGVRPRDISWRGAKGIAFLHFSKGKPSVDAPVAVDDIVASLQGLQIKTEGSDGPGAIVKVEPAVPVTRIEVVNVAQV